MKNNTFKIVGGKQLFGTVKVQASKNGTLPLICASILCKGETIIKNCPQITDIFNMQKILTSLNVKNFWQAKDLHINSIDCQNLKINPNLASKIRASIFLLGALLNRFKTCKISLPGGCKIGARPIDIHINSLKSLNVKVKECNNFLFFDATQAKAGKVKLRLPSVGATENMLLFACTLPGKTTIMNAAKEPEIVELANFLNVGGAKILGAGTRKITIYGVNSIKQVGYTPSSDRIVAGTIMIATAMCGGSVNIIAPYNQNKNLIKKLRSMGCKITKQCDIIKVSSNGKLSNLKRVSTGYYPKFPTDLQSLLLVASVASMGKVKFCEHLFENRFLIASQLNKMGANITKKSANTILVNGTTLKPGKVFAQDLRGAAALVLAALKAHGTSYVKNIHFLDRGYENFEQVLTMLGANVKRI